MGPAAVMWASWALVAFYGAAFAWREMWPQAVRLLRRAAALYAFGAPGASRAASGLALRACGWLVAWVLMCTLWAALLLWSGQRAWARVPVAALFG